MGKEMGEVSSNMPRYYAFDTLHTLTMATTATFKSKRAT